MHVRCKQCCLRFMKSYVASARMRWSGDHCGLQIRRQLNIAEVRFLLRAHAAAEAAFGHSRSCGSGERWNDPVLPNRARPPNRWHMPGHKVLDHGRGKVSLVLAEVASSGSNGLQSAYFCSHLSCLDPPFLDSKESNRVCLLLSEFRSGNKK